MPDPTIVYNPSTVNVSINTIAYDASGNLIATCTLKMNDSDDKLVAINKVDNTQLEVIAAQNIPVQIIFALPVTTCVGYTDLTITHIDLYPRKVTTTNSAPYSILDPNSRPKGVSFYYSITFQGFMGLKPTKPIVWDPAIENQN